MNLILFKDDEDLGFIPADDKRAWHINNILKSKVADKLDFGIINGKTGKLTITKIDSNGVYFTGDACNEPHAPYPITLIIGTPRPPVAKRLLKDLTTSGVKRIIMCGTDLGEKTYLTSGLWKDDKFMNYIHDGLIQGEATILPVIDRYFSVKKAIESLDQNCDRLMLDNVKPDFKISNYKPDNNEVVIAIGGERGFTDRERDMFKESGFKVFSMGKRVLRTETVCHQIVGTILASKNLI